MRQIKNWTAIRSGKTLTVSGFDPATDAPVKLTHVSRIIGCDGKVLARTNADTVELVHV